MILIIIDINKNISPLNLRLTTYCYFISIIILNFRIISCSAFSQGIRVWRVGYGAFCRRTAIELIVAHKVVHVYQKNRFGVQLLTVIRQVELVFLGQVVDVVRLQVRPVFHHVHLFLKDKKELVNIFDFVVLFNVTKKKKISFVVF